MRAHIFLQRPAADPLESACLAVVTHRQTLVFCASFPGGDFFGACPKPHRAMHGSMYGFAGLEVFGAFQSGPRDGGAGLGIHLCSGTQDRASPQAGAPLRSCGATSRHAAQDIPLELAEHAPNPGRPAQARQEGGRPVGRQKASAGSWAQVRSRALTTCSQAVILGSS